MCQLFAMTSKRVADISFSFAGFRRRGGLTDDHTDGFGVAYFEPTGLRLYCDDRAAMDSPIADLVSSTKIKATTTIAHLRKSDDSLLCNAHPFTREIWGESWVFSHNGKMTIQEASEHDAIKQGVSRYYCPVGDTDSEFAFCYLLNQLKERFEHKPDDETLFKFLTKQCRFLANYGLFNCLLSNGEWLLSYATTLLFYVTRRAPFGLATLIDAEVDTDNLTIDFAQVNNSDDVITIIATTPLTSDEDWQQLAINECVIFAEGEIVYQDVPDQPTYLSIEKGLEIAKNK